ncbi:MAG: hypothetical protein CR982_08205 [Candidatus Cloacimonadota bacterium]|nr:MAG: hypothetical protein CR982_08205 [Candidatus Cloacimonadota bacterium]PIE77660.1 MAG: hypothetical protein CSA15_12105 [Candidatus Delongbacteria bacterium]
MKINISLLLFLIVSVYGTTFISLKDKRVYDMLENLDSRGVIDIKFKGMKPYRVDKVYKLLKSIDKKDINIESFIREFEERYINIEERLLSGRKGKAKGGISPFLDQSIVFQGETDGSNEDLANITDVGINADLSYGKHLSFSSKTGVKFNYEGLLLRDEYRNALIFDHTDNSFSSEDYSETFLMYSNNNIDLSIGRAPVQQGSGYINSLSLREQHSYFDLIYFNWEFSSLKFSTVSGFLLPDYETRYEYKDSLFTNGQFVEKYTPKRREKYLSSHRLEWRVSKNFWLGINENLIYGDRGVELGYLFPILPLKWSEHYYGDHDNSTMSFDFYYKPIKNISLYGELFIDDETWQKSFTEYYGNKWAVLGGFYYADLFTIPYLNFRFETTRIEPWVYTHKYHINRYMSCEDYLGGEFGPDSESFMFSMDYRWNFLVVKLGYKRANVGEPIEGNEDEQVGYENYPDVKKFFLNGNVENHYYYSFEADYRYNKYLSFNLYYSHRDIVDYNHIKGNIYSNNSIGVSLKLNILETPLFNY